MIWGVDLGVRSLYAFGLTEDGSALAFKAETPKMETRAMELKALGHEFRGFFDSEDKVFVEEPPLAGARNIRTFAALNQVFSVALYEAPSSYKVEVSSWKKEVLGKGNASKEEVTCWLNDHSPVYAALCGDQNHIDAACIALYGRAILSRL